jgi:branched-chain amino acid transport system permease protein|tara:strand:+ start:1255 stop:2163 length:909 start_codon:yes stop_codon:yes gene_type:complete
LLVLEYAISGLLFGSTYSLVAIGFTLIFGVLNRFNIAHGATLMVAAFGGATISILFGGKDSYIILIAAFLSATVIGAIVGLIVRQIAFAPLRGGSELSPFVTSAAMALILEELFVNLTQSVSIYSMEVTEFPSPLENLVFFLGEIYIRGAYLVIFLMALIIMGILHWWLHHTKSGLAIRCVEENPTAAWLMGINGNRVEIIVFAVASAIAGAAGCLISVAYGTVTPFLGSNLLLVSFVVLVLAGIGSVRGAMICGLFVGVIETVTAGLISAQTKEAVLFIILFIVLLVKPQGIFATSATERD